MKSRIELKFRARELFFNNWVVFALSAAVLWIVSRIQVQIMNLQTVPEESILLAEATPGMEIFAETWRAAPDFGIPNWQIYLAIFLIGVLWAVLDYGFSSLALRAVKDEDLPDVEVFSAYKRFGRWVIFYLIYMVKVMLWSIFFIIPGIIAALNYSQAVFLMVEDEKLKPLDAIKKSIALMRGRKLELFTIWVSFIGFHILALFSWGVSTLYSAPYMKMTYAGYYRELITAQSNVQSSAWPGVHSADDVSRES
ncbi:MAG: DUF975 family protein [Coriobacteriia bacterium]|nr:DUF975 family protein [Coriobacteriia bacterium]